MITELTKDEISILLLFAYENMLDLYEPYENGSYLPEHNADEYDAIANYVLNCINPEPYMLKSGDVLTECEYYDIIRGAWKYGGDAEIIEEICDFLKQ